MSSIQHILDKEKKAEEIIKEAEKESLEIKQRAKDQQKIDLEKVSQTLEKERQEKIDYQKGQLVQQHKEITDKGIIEQKNILSKTTQNKKRAIDLILENISK